MSSRIRSCRDWTEAAPARQSGGVKDDRLRIDAEPAYTAALGLAVYAFATLEWQAIRWCERIRPGSFETLHDRTAGRVADMLKQLVSELPASEQQRALEGAAADFQAFTRTRNNLVHAKPGTGHDGRPRLFRDGDQWTIEEMEGVADAFAGCAVRLEQLLRADPAEPS